MEFVDGQTLKSHISSLTSGTGVPVLQAIDWIEQIAHGTKNCSRCEYYPSRYKNRKCNDNKR